MSYFEEKRMRIQKYAVSDIVKNRLLDKINKEETLVGTLNPTTAEKYVNTLRVIDILNEWEAYVTSLNECAYSDSMLENAARLITETAANI